MLGFIATCLTIGAAYFIAASLVGKLLRDSARRSAHMAAVDALNKITGGER